MKLMFITSTGTSIPIMRRQTRLEKSVTGQSTFMGNSQDGTDGDDDDDSGP